MTAVTTATRHFTASGAVFDTETRRILLVHHQRTELWQFPGGHVDPDEDGFDTVIREVREETGVQAALYWPTPNTQLFPALDFGRVLPAPAMVVEFPDPGSRREPEHRHIDLLYVLVATVGQVVPQYDEVSDVAWWPLDGLNRPDVRSDVPAVVPFAWRHLTGEVL